MIRLAATARCLRRECGWTTSGDPGSVDRAADKHTKAGHPTATLAMPATTTTERKAP